MNELRKQLDFLWEAYDNDVHRMAQNVFYKTIKPYLIKRNLRFVVTDGNWFTESKESGTWMRDYHHIYVAKSIVNILDMNVLGMPFKCFGMHMPDFDPEQENKYT